MEYKVVVERLSVGSNIFFRDQVITDDDLRNHNPNVLLGSGFIECLFKKNYDIKDLGSGWYELPNGIKIRGKEKAIKILEGD